jgi:phage gpG-like protein
VAGFEVNISMDPDRFLAAITDWGKQSQLEGHLASLDAAKFIKELVQEKLASFPHPRSEPTPTLPFKGPPGYISGHLHDSVTIEETALADYVKVYPTAVYSRIQELGGWTGTDHMTWIPPRPYFLNTVEELETTGPGGIEHIYYEHWRRAQIRALAF